MAKVFDGECEVILPLLGGGEKRGRWRYQRAIREVERVGQSGYWERREDGSLRYWPPSAFAWPATVRESSDASDTLLAELRHQSEALARLRLNEKD